MSKNILVYLDEGVGPHAFRQLYMSLQVELASLPYVLQAVNHQFLIREKWEKDTALLVIPGGRDIFYHSYLQGVGNTRIHAFVAEGGCYMGLCAGGYYGAASIEFEKGGKLEVCGERELAFYPGRAVGPAYGLRRFSYESDQGARVALLNWEGGRSRIYFNGGCYFEHPECHPSVDILARYEDLPEAPAAVVRCPVGKGQAILCGVHPEFEMTPSLDKQRRVFWKYLLNKSLIKI